MALPINIEDLLNRRKIESNRIEFKKGWNPTDIYRSIGAFANDFDNLGGGYILVGVEEANGVALFVPVHKGCCKRVILNVPVNDTVNATVNATANLNKTQKSIIGMITENNRVTYNEMIEKIGLIDRIYI